MCIPGGAVEYLNGLLPLLIRMHDDGEDDEPMPMPLAAANAANANC